MNQTLKAAYKEFLIDYHDNGIVKFAAEEDDLLEKEVPVTNDVLEAIKECPTRALLKD